MRTLLRTLQDRDPGFLQIVCELWGLDLLEGPAQEFPEKLSNLMLRPDELEDLIESLPDPARDLIDYLLEEGGKVPFAQVDRKFGPMRDMGPGRRDREQPWRQPVSALEMAWYRGLLGRAFADSPLGPQEFVYIPSDLQLLIDSGVDATTTPLGRAADQPAHIDRADTSSVDDATTLLAAFRKKAPEANPLTKERRLELIRFLYRQASIDLLVQLLVDLEFLEPGSFEPAPEKVGAFLEAPRSDALQALITAWRDTTSWNDLAALPHLHFASANWPNDARLSRNAAFDLMSSIPIGEWWEIDAFLSDIRNQYPAFQRPGGDFQSWYLQDGSGAFLNGIEHWESVDGAYLRHLIQCPMHWLGMTDLGRRGPGQPVHSFRLTTAWKALFEQELVLHVDEPDFKIIVHPDGEVVVPRGADRVTRYQIARVSAWEQPDRLGHHFRLTPATLQQAGKQGLTGQHVLQRLTGAVDGELPPSIVRAVTRWSESGVEAHLSNVVLLRATQASILETLASQKSTARYIDEILTPTTAIIRQSDWPALRDAAARLGLLLDPPID